MTRVLRLTDSNGTTTVDLLAGPLRLQSTSWSTRTPPVNGAYRHSEFGAQPVFKNYGVGTEQLYLVGDDTAGNLVIAANAIEALLEQARLYHADPMRNNAVWLEWGTDGEAVGSNQSNIAKRALVYEGSLRFLAGTGVSPMMKHQVLRVRLSLSRHPLWEDAIARSVTNSGAVNAFGGVWQPLDPFDLSNLAGGTAPMRMQRFSVDGADGGGGPIYRLWVGVRAVRAGTSGFVPVLELENGTTGTDAAVVADAAASGGNRVDVSFATVGTMAERIALKLGDVASTDYTHFAGRYVLLLRYQVTDASTVCRLRLRYGFRNAGGLLENEAVYTFENTSNWRLLPLGEVQFPPGMRAPYNQTAFKNIELVIEAERVTGSGTLALDAVCLMPAEHLVTLEGGDVQKNATFANGVSVYTFDGDGTGAEALFYDAPAADYQLNTNVGYSARGWYFPVEGGIVVFAGERVDQHVLSDAALLSMYVTRRWLGYRGL